MNIEHSLLIQTRNNILWPIREEIPHSDILGFIPSSEIVVKNYGTSEHHRTLRQSALNQYEYISCH